MRPVNICILTAYLFAVIFCFSCTRTPSSAQAQDEQQKHSSEPNVAEPNNPHLWNRPRSNERLDERKKMVQILRSRYEFSNEPVLDAMLNVPRHWFVPFFVRPAAYDDTPLPIGHGQTISQPFIVAYMTGLLELGPDMKVLEIGTGSGYQAAVLSEFTPYVYTIEILKPLAENAKKQLAQRGYDTIKVRLGDGYKGWPQYAPFDAVIVTCAPDHIPQPLIDQLKPSGRIVIPVGQAGYVQDLIVAVKKPDGSLEKKSMMPVRFVPLLREKPED
jgi:protein-L-isoaspartate(D-aspartate) O-methyltransferase